MNEERITQEKIVPQKECMQTKIIQTKTVSLLTTPTKEMKEVKIIQKTIVLQKEHMNSSNTKEKRPDKGKDHSNKRKREHL